MNTDEIYSNHGIEERWGMELFRAFFFLHTIEIIKEY